MNASTCVVCGATGRGKTTVVNGLVRETLREEILLGTDDEDARATERARAVVDEAHRARAFTDVANFTLRCLVCQKGLVGEKDAVAHAKSTGHQNFSEY